MTLYLQFVVDLKKRRSQESCGLLKFFEIYIERSLASIDHCCEHTK